MILNPVKDLKIKCAEAGTNLTEICREAGVDRSLPERWKTNLPESIQIYNKLLLAIETIKAKKQKQHA